MISLSPYTTQLSYLFDVLVTHVQVKHREHLYVVFNVVQSDCVIILYDNLILYS